MMDEFEEARKGKRSQGTSAPCEEEEEPRGSWTATVASAIAQEPVSRRGFLQGAALATGLLAGGLTAGEVSAEEPNAVAARLLPLTLTINGEQKSVQVDPRITVLDLLREQLGMTGTKKGCDHGQCGSCTVIANGRRVNSCLSLALVYQGGTITTIEGLAHGDELHPVQTAFLEHDGYQCGYCTPGQILSGVALLDEVKRGEPSVVTANLRDVKPIELTEIEIKERMSGNLCRCGAYPGIVAAVRQAAGQVNQS